MFRHRSELPILEAVINIRNRLTALKKNRGEFIKSADVNQLYQAIVKQGSYAARTLDNPPNGLIQEKLRSGILVWDKFWSPRAALIRVAIMAPSDGSFWSVKWGKSRFGVLSMYTVMAEAACRMASVIDATA
ncbi:hypothetical protein TRAPUB_13709 [Trametes pubescens]|uniref:Uncharacterized protein n=1 Tax=Trametes pubescens TaxID=154538 RepID=A0A1M2VQF1_TRAPU|nr:hypothetical protein TRAPUB_13709 [Trametes pubescens]